MPAKRRSMADLLAEQGAIEDPAALAPRRGLASVGEPAPDPAPPAAPLAPIAAAIPEPRRDAAGDGPLSASEQSDLSVCEAALDNLRMAFWAAGKALQTVRDGRLYRAGYGTFEEYVEQRWDMSRAQANRLIDAWPLAERLSPMGDKINERQIRELMPVSDTHGQDAAVIVYETVAGTDGVTVTAAVLHKVVHILPAGNFDRDKAVAQIRAYLARELIVREIPPAADPVMLFSVQADKTISKLEQVTADVLEAARAADPELVSRMASRMRALADQLEHGPSA